MRRCSLIAPRRLLAAGLTDEAVSLAEHAASELRGQGDDVDLAETLMLVARAALLGGDDDRAARASGEATALFAAQNREGWWAAAASLNVEARLRARSADDDDVTRIEAVIEATRAAGLAPACAEARLVAAELAASRDEWERLRQHLDAVVRSDLGLAARCRLDLLRARELAASRELDDALATCATAVDEFGELTAELGGTELRAHVALHVTELVATGLELAVQREDPWLAFEWSERQRATALAAAPVRPPDDVELAADLDRLRAALTQFDAGVRDGTRHGTVAPELAPESAILQDRIRRRARLGRRAVATAPRAGAVEDVIAAGLAAWVSYIEVGGRLAALRVADGVVTIVELGDVARARQEASVLRSVLTMHLTATGRGVERDPAPLMASAAAADDVLLGPLELPDGPVVVSPIAGLHDLPWGLLPSLRPRSFVLAPSVALWKRCEEVTAGVPRDVVAVAGPGLPFADVEVEKVAVRYGASTVLVGAEASVGASSVAMTGADVVHLACHGRFSRREPDVLLAAGRRRPHVRLRPRAHRSAAEGRGPFGVPRRRPRDADRARDPGLDGVAARDGTAGRDRGDRPDPRHARHGRRDGAVARPSRRWSPSGRRPPGRAWSPTPSSAGRSPATVLIDVGSRTSSEKIARP